MSVVYVITHKGKVVYVGKTKHFKIRKQQHLSLNSSTADWLQEIGIDNVEITQVAECPTEYEAISLEGELIDKYDTYLNGYNKCRSGHVYASPTYKQDYNKAYFNTDEYRERHRENAKREEVKEKRRAYEQTEECKRRRQITNRAYYLKKKARKMQESLCF